MSNVIQGVIHGQTIELASDPGLDDGQVVEVVVRVVRRSDLPPGEGILRSAGAIADDPVAQRELDEIVELRRGETRLRSDDDDELDAFLEEARKSRHAPHRDIEP